MTGSPQVEASRLIQRAWRKRYEAMLDPPVDKAALQRIVKRVEADLLRACAICRQAGASRELSIALGKLGHLALDEGDRDRALDLFEQATAAASEAGDPLRVAHAMRHLGQVHHRLGQLEQAERACRQAVDLYDGASAASPLDHANALRPLALLREECGDTDEAGALWRRAARLYRIAGVGEGVEECEARIARLHPDA